MDRKKKREKSLPKEPYLTKRVFIIVQVAVKVMKKKYNTIEECQGQFEPKLLDLLPNHINIVQLRDSYLAPNCELSFIMEYMDGGNLYQLMRERRHHKLPFNQCELKSIL